MQSQQDALKPSNQDFQSPQSENSLLLHAFDFPPLSGGISRVCGEIAFRLSRKYNVTVISQKSQSMESSEYSSQPSQLKEIRISARPPVREAKASLELRKNWRKGMPVICGTWYPEGLTCATLGLKPLIILAHGAELFPPRNPLLRPAWKRMAREVLSKADLIIANSQYTRRLVLDLAPQANVIAHPLGVNTETFRPAKKELAITQLVRNGVISPGEEKMLEDKFLIGSVSRIYRFKGFENVFEALAKMAPQDRKDIVYLIAGSGPDRFFLQRAAERLGIASTIKWIGQVPESSLPHFYQALDLFVLCTLEEPWNRRVEGLGLVFLESQACGVPVVGSDTGGIPDAVTSDEGGWLIDPEDRFELSRLFKKLQSSPELLKEASQKARKRILESYSWDRFIDELEKHLIKLQK